MKVALLLPCLFSIAWAAASAVAYDVGDFNCPAMAADHDNACFYKGQPVLAVPGDLETHIRRVAHESADEYVANELALTRSAVDVILAGMHQDWMDLVEAHPFYDWAHASMYRRQLPVYDEYGRRLRALRLGPHCTALTDSFNKVIDFKRMSVILDAFRGPIQLSHPHLVTYFGEAVKTADGKRLAEERPADDQSDPLAIYNFMVDAQVIPPEEVARLLDAMEMARPALSTAQKYKAVMDDIQRRHLLK
jgi:hypothetical protein